MTCMTIMINHGMHNPDMTGMSPVSILKNKNIINYDLLDVEIMFYFQNAALKMERSLFNSRDASSRLISCIVAMHACPTWEQCVTGWTLSAFYSVDAFGCHCRWHNLAGHRTTKRVLQF